MKKRLRTEECILHNYLEYLKLISRSCTLIIQSKDIFAKIHKYWNIPSKVNFLNQYE
jgi:hypothetical protein